MADGGRRWSMGRERCEVVVAKFGVVKPKGKLLPALLLVASSTAHPAPLPSWAAHNELLPSTTTRSRPHQSRDAAIPDPPGCTTPRQPRSWASCSGKCAGRAAIAGGWLGPGGVSCFTFISRPAPPRRKHRNKLHISATTLPSAAAPGAREIAQATLLHIRCILVSQSPGLAEPASSLPPRATSNNNVAVAWPG